MTKADINLTLGKLIVVEGLDGWGKSTQVYLTKRWLELDKVKVFLLSGILQ